MQTDMLDYSGLCDDVTLTYDEARAEVSLDDPTWPLFDKLGLDPEWWEDRISAYNLVLTSFGDLAERLPLWASFVAQHGRQEAYQATTVQRWLLSVEPKQGDDLRRSRPCSGAAQSAEERLLASMGIVLDTSGPAPREPASGSTTAPKGEEVTHGR